MEKDEYNIQFDQMPDLDWNWGKAPKSEIVEVEKEYDSLFEELLDKCNPSKFNIESFGLERFNAANEIFAQLKSLGNNIAEKELTLLRDKAIDELGIQISTNKKFGDLKSFLDPEQYINRQPYDKELVATAGGLYNQLLANRNDIRALETLESDPQIAILKDECDYMNLGAIEYLEKHPDGNHKAEAEESVNKIRLQKRLREEKEEQLNSWKRFYDKIVKEGQCVSLKTLDISGRDIIALKPEIKGPQIGEILNVLLNEVLENPDLNRKELLLERAKEL